MGSTKASTTVQVEMEFEKETKNSYRYKEVKVEGQAPRIGQFYIQQHALPGKPERITVTVTASAQ